MSRKIAREGAVRKTALMLGFVAAYLASLPSLALAWSGKVLGVIDGDRIIFP
jgi:hypothetical protein